MYSFEFIDLNNVNLEEFNSFPKKTPFTTVPWLRFISEDKDAIPKIIRITQGEELIGYFTGLVFNKLGIKFFGSPFKGWSTNYMGFDLYDYTLISSLLEPTIDFVMKETKCLYLELVDRNITTENIVSTRFQTDIVTDLEVDIDKSDEELLKSVKKDCRKYICQFESRGAYIETVVPDDEFIETLHKQLCEVFEKQNLVPPYSLEKIKICVKYLKESDMMLCLRIKEPKGEVIASFIFLGLNKKCIGWCASSTSKFQHLRPNEYIIWHGIRKFRDRGFTVFDLSGPRDYKYKWNPHEIKYARITATKYPFLKKIRDAALKSYWLSLKIKGLSRKVVSFGEVLSKTISRKDEHCDESRSFMCDNAPKRFI